MAHRRALVGNAADKEQVEYGGKTVARRRARLLGALQSVMATPAGRFALADALDRIGIDDTSYVADHHLVYFRDGMRAAKAMLEGFLREADEKLFELLGREYRGWCRSDDREVEAAQTRMAEVAEDET